MATKRRLANPSPAEFFTELCDMWGIVPVRAEGNSMSGELTITFQRVTTGPVDQNKLPGCDGLRIAKVVFNAPATIVYWSDNSKTVVKAGGNDPYDPEKGLAMAIAKKVMGNQSNYYNEFRKWLVKPEEKEEQEANE
jgi:hypothetical protein